MKQNKIRLTESQLKRFINESVSQILEYNEDWAERVNNCKFLSDKEKKDIQIASMNNWDKHEREEKKKQDMEKLERLANKNIYDRRIVRESWGDKRQSDLMDVIIMLKEAYFDIQEYSKQNKMIGYDLAEAMGNLRGAIKILNNMENNNNNKRQNIDIL